MRINYIFNALSLILRYISPVILVPIIIALIYGEKSSILPFLVASLTSIILGFILRRKQTGEANFNDLKKTEALVVVTGSWIVFSLISAIPYLFFGFSPINSIFEAVSGITTTGATILTDFDYPKTMFFWRSLTQWLGGMGIIVLFIAVLPQFAVAGRQMFSAEAPGPTEEKITPRIRQTASSLWVLYVGLTLLETILLKFAGMPLFDSICNSFSTMSAGGFSPNPNSIMGYNSSLIVNIITIFMFLAGVNFVLQYKVFFQFKIKELFKNSEFKLYCGLFLFFGVLTAYLLHILHYETFLNSISNSLFQTISVMTSTGFASIDFNSWPSQVKTIFFLVFFIGGSAGSAAGGVKVVRWLFVKNYLTREMVKTLHPKAVIPIKIDKKVISSEICDQMISFVAFFFIIFFISVFIVYLIEDNMTIALTGSIGSLGNVGPGYGSIGPLGSYANLFPVTKIIFIITMLIGRLELIPFLVFLNPETWNIKKT